MKRIPFAWCWIITGMMALLASGALAMIVTAAKIPLFAAWATRHLMLVRWCLVEHVNLANLIWFSALPAGLIQLATSANQPRVARATVAAWLLALAGIAALLVCHPGLDARPVLSNYIPVLDHRLYLSGLAAYLAGVTWVHLAHVFSFGGPESKSDTADPHASRFEAVRFGLWLGSVYFLAAMTTLVFAWRGTAPIAELSSAVYYDVLFWGSGHLLQHASSCFLVAAWILLLTWSTPGPAFTRSEVFPVFAWMSLPLLALPFLLAQRPATDVYRQTFTELMRWGIAPPMATFLLLASRRLVNGLRTLPSHRRSALLFSVLLIILGVAFGLGIRGADLRVPGHYHATIGAITIAFMTLAYAALGGERASARHRLINLAIPLYGTGQLLFSSGLFIAGYFGLGRKAYGVEQDVTHPGHVAGLFSVSVGGVLALLGGVLFALAWTRLLLQVSRADHAPADSGSPR